MTNSRTLIVLFFFSLSNFRTKRECDALNTAFGRLNGLFIQCTNHHNKIATYCIDCLPQYSDLTVTYHDLTADQHPDNITCRPEYVDVNRLNLVETLMSNSKHVWDMAYCSGLLNMTTIQIIEIKLIFFFFCRLL